MANKVRERRRSLGITQVQLSQMSGLTQQAISRIESFGVTPKTATQEKLAAALDATIDELFGEGE